MPVTQRKRSFQLFRKLQFCTQGAVDDESSLDIDRMILHSLDCLGALSSVVGNVETAKLKVFWNAVRTISEIGLDSLTGHIDKRHPGASHLIRAFPNESKVTDGRGWLPLHWAAVCDDITAEDIKIIGRADPLATVKGFNQPYSANPGHLIAAKRNPDMKVVKCLYDFYPRMAYSKDIQGDLPLHYAARYTNSIPLIQFLLQANPSAMKCKGDNDLIPLQCAIYNEDAKSRYAVIKSLLQVDQTLETARMINVDGDTVLHLAVANECCQQLIDYLVSINPNATKIQNKCESLPLHIACSLNNAYTSDIVDTLLNTYCEGATVKNSHGLLPAHIAAEHSSVEVLEKVILKYHEAINIPSSGDLTPLHHAIIGNNFKSVKYLVEAHPACVLYGNFKGYLPLHTAVSSGYNINIIKTLHYAYPEAIRTFSTDGKLPLHVFAIEDHDHVALENDVSTNILRFLLKSYPEAVNIPDANGNTVYSLCRQDNKFYRRLILRSMPSLNYNEYIELNYQSRRLAMFLSFAAINANGIPNIWCKLRENDMKLLQLAVSFL